MNQLRMKSYLSLCIVITMFFYSTLLGQNKVFDKLLKQNIISADSVIIFSHDVTAEYYSEEAPDWNIKDTSMNLEKWKALHPKPTRFFENGKINRKIVKEYIVLNDSTKSNLISILYKPLQSNKIKIIKCDEPRHTIVIYNKNKESFLDICFTCLRIHTSKDIRFDEYNLDDIKWVELEQFFKTNGLTKFFEKDDASNSR